jgi:cellulose biosynthesis protein BcsQ
MSYFATFYSYKGGVGRTLALANTAWLIANHPTEPARVLVVDFDLGAPGLSHVLGMPRASHASGFIDYVAEYTKNAAIPDARRFIHKTAYENIDIIPAGKMDRLYQRRLERIDWKTLYEGAFGYELIEKLKSDISSIQPEYEYVLIDSLTGYTDVGGICVNQLPDLLILLFRLNQQNLDGIDKVNRAAALSVGGPKTTIPVISPSWPFIDEAAGRWIEKAQELFPHQQLLEVSFDSSLSFGERIISREASKLRLASKLLEDYRRLAARIRQHNPLDCLTIWQSVQRGSPREFADPSDLYLNLLKRRPNNLEYWRGLSTIHAYPSPEREELKKFIDQQADGGNKLALLARAGIHDGEDKTKKAALDLDRALQIDPEFFDALLQRARTAYIRRQLGEALRDFSKCLEVHQRANRFPRSKIEAELARTHLDMFNGGAALRTIGSAIGEDPSDPTLYRIRAKALYLEGDYPSALADSRRIAKLDQPGEPVTLLPAQILAAMGQTEEAGKELESLAQQIHRISDANLAEAYLAVDPRSTISLLSSPLVLAEPPVRALLMGLARILAGAEQGPTPEERPRIDPQKWSFFEVVALLRAKERARSLNPEAIEAAYSLIRSMADETTFSMIARSRAQPNEGRSS